MASEDVVRSGSVSAVDLPARMVQAYAAQGLVLSITEARVAPQNYLSASVVSPLDKRLLGLLHKASSNQAALAGSRYFPLHT